MNDGPKKRYRYVDPWATGGAPELQEFYEVRKTPSGAWIVPGWSYARMARPLEERSAQELRDDWGAKFVLDGDGRRYAHETEAWARVGYAMRKHAQIRHAKAALSHAQTMLHWLDTGELPEPGVFAFRIGDAA